MQVHSIESLAALDGEGLRYELFLAGCPLRCACCHNPDTWSASVGQQMSCEQLLRKILRYVPYFADGGGVTFSGGEPLLQAAEIAQLGEMLRQNGVGYALDTSGCVPLTDAVCRAVAGADMVICDLKYPDTATMQQYTGGEFAQVTAFLDHLKKTGKRTWVRTVVIPGINDSTAWMDRYLAVLEPYRSIIERYELLGFHTMGFFKYEKLGLCNPLADRSALSQEKLAELQAYVKQHFAPAYTK